MRARFAIAGDVELEQCLGQERDRWVLRSAELPRRTLGVDRDEFAAAGATLIRQMLELGFVVPAGARRG